MNGPWRRTAAIGGWLVSCCLMWAVVLAAPGEAAAWQWPLAGTPRVVRGFDPPATPYGAGHRGVDLAGQPGTQIRAAGPGVVGYAGLLAGRGVVTVLHAGGLRTTYEPVLAAVRAGQLVAAGEVLGRLGAGHPGCPTASCLHWGLLHGETYLDPLALLGLARVRLLPWPVSGGSAAAPPMASRRSATPVTAVTPSPAGMSGGGSRAGALGLLGMLAAGTLGAAVLRRRRQP